MNLPEITGPAAALAAGAITSLHCLGMCGPLLCVACSKGGCGADKNAAGAWTAPAYHGGRLVSYAAAGALAGLLGRALAPIFSGWLPHALPWAFALLFAVVALGLDQKLTAPLASSGLWSRQFAAIFKLPPFTRAGMLGLASPLLPCGPLYMVIGVAALSAGPGSGALLVGAFALGTVPLLWLAQAQWFRIQHRFSPVTLDRAKRVFAAAAAVMLVMRGLSSATPFAPHCPLCPQ